MELSTSPTVTLDAAYVESHGADGTSPERALWVAVLAQAADDLFSSDEQIRQDAATFFKSPDLLRVLDLAGMSRAEAPWLRRRALELASTSQDTGPGKRISFRGETRSLTGWAKVTGINITTLCRRLRQGWTVTQTLTLPPQKAGRRGLQ